MILTDREIRERIVRDGLIKHASLFQTKEGPGGPCISYGVSHSGYDMRLSATGAVLVPKPGRVHDPKACRARKTDMWEPLPVHERGYERFVILPPAAMALGVSAEWFCMPRDVTGVVLGKSTLAREGVLINCTPLEPGWQGYLTIEIINLNHSNPVVLYLGEGVAQVQFHQHNPVETSYADKHGKYQNQPEQPTLAIV